MQPDHDTIDPRGLIRESYRIDGITVEECRSIFLDWAISVPEDADNLDYVQRLLERYGAENPNHLMTGVLQNALKPVATARRRGGARGRRQG